MISNYAQAFPRLIDSDDPEWNQFIIKLDEIDTYIRLKIEGLDALLDYEMCPVQYLPRLGKIVEAGIEDWDSETIKRKKIRSAIQRHKFSTTWLYDVKIAVETITSYTAYLFNFRNISNWVWDADRELTTELGWNVSRWDAARTFPNSKSWNADREAIKGRVYIGVLTDAVTDEIWERVKIESYKFVPEFLEIHFGYLLAGIWYEKEVVNQVSYE